MKNLLLPFFMMGLLLSGIACNGDPGSFGPATEADMYAEKRAPDTDNQLTSAEEASFDQGEAPVPAIERQVIRQAAMRMAVEDYSKALPLIRQEIQHWDASLEREEEHRDAFRLENELVIRVLPEKLDSLLSALELLALQVDFKRIEARDVTQQYVDLTTRLDAKRDAVDRYRQILQTARTVEEVLDVEDHLRQLIEEIESTERQLRALRDQVNMSTLQLSVYEEFSRPELRRKSFWSRVGSAFGDGWQVFLSLLVGLVSIWPVALILAALGFWFFRIRRRKKG